MNVPYFLLHVFSALDSRDPRLLAPHLVAWLHDLLFLSLLLFALRGAIFFLPYRQRNAGEGLAVAVLLTAGLLLSLYPQMLREYLSFPVNLFSGGASSASVLLTEYLGFSHLLPAVFAFMAGVGPLLMPSGKGLPVILRRPLFALWCILLSAGLVTLPRSPHPLVNSFRDEFGTILFHSHRDVPQLLPASTRRGVFHQSGSNGLAISGHPKACHIYLIVLEGVTADQFETHVLGQGSTFFQRVRHQAIYFDKYYTTNLDSYTSLIAMLTSEQVPYRSYTDTGLYDAVNGAGNLVRSFRKLGYHTLFLSTYEYQPFIPVRNDWSRIMHRADLPTINGYVSVESSRMESATEDRAALSTLIAFPLHYPKTFVLHELVYGHSTAWRAKTGITQLAYYDAFLNELIEGLVASGVWSNSLLVVVSDHGDRSKAANAGNYRVPLLVAGAGVVPGLDHQFRSHLELQRIINAVLTGGAMPTAMSEMVTVGSTERWVYGMINGDGGHLFIDDHTGKVIASQGNMDSKSVHRKFQGMIDDFGRRFGP